MRNPVKHSVVHSLGTLRPPRNFAASSPKLSISVEAERRGTTSERCDGPHGLVCMAVRLDFLRIGYFEADAVFALEDFERVVFVIAVLE